MGLREKSAREHERLEKTKKQVELLQGKMAQSLKDITEQEKALRIEVAQLTAQLTDMSNLADYAEQASVLSPCNHCVGAV